jgi:hypothetical protein
MKTVILIILLIFENCNFCKSKIEGLKLEKINKKCYVYLKEYDVYILHRRRKISKIWRKNL